MFYSIIGYTLLIIAGLLLLMALRILIKPTWFLGWVKGMLGLVMVASAAFVALMAWEFKHYKAWQIDKPLATVSFEELEPQNYLANLAISEEGITREYTINGDQWQLDARILRWKGVLANVGLSPGYRLERVSGRYLSIDDENNRTRTLYSLLDDRFQAFDFWTWLYPYKDYLPMIDLTYGSATFIPMMDGALYEVLLTRTGLAAKPLNEAAEKAVNQWIK